MADNIPVREVDPRSANADAPVKRETQFKVAERRDDDTVVLDLGDGRMVVAKVAEGVEGIRKGATVTIKAKSYTDDGVPEDAEVTKVS